MDLHQSSRYNTGNDLRERNSTILIAGNGADSLQNLELTLNSAGFHARIANSVEEALALVAEQRFQLILLDISMHGIDGYQVVHKLHADPASLEIPIIVISDRNDVTDQVQFLELGADDYLYQPLEPSLLVARVKARMRRFTSSAPDRFTCGNLVIDRSERSVRLGEQAIPVSDAEFDLLWLLASNAGKVLSRNDIFHAIRGLEYDGLDRSIDKRISRLRKLLGDDSENSQIIKAVRNQGYLFSRRNWS
jgi:two-component system, OmpR family, response regulator RstA